MYLLFQLCPFPIQFPLRFLQRSLVLSKPFGRREPFPKERILQEILVSISASLYDRQRQ
jgi:hypothetical protein